MYLNFVSKYKIDAGKKYLALSGSPSREDFFSLVFLLMALIVVSGTEMVAVM